MHSNRMRTARSLTVSPSICHTYHPTTHTPLPCMHPAKHAPPHHATLPHTPRPAKHVPPAMQPCHTHPNLPNMPPLPCNPATHTDLPCIPPCHATLPHTPTCHTSPLPCNPATHTDLPCIPLPCMPPVMHTSATHAPYHTHPSLPPLWTEL